VGSNDDIVTLMKAVDGKIPYQLLKVPFCGGGLMIALGMVAKLDRYPGRYRCWYYPCQKFCQRVTEEKAQQSVSMVSPVYPVAMAEKKTLVVHGYDG